MLLTFLWAVWVSHWLFTIHWFITLTNHKQEKYLFSSLWYEENQDCLAANIQLTFSSLGEQLFLGSSPKTIFQMLQQTKIYQTSNCSIWNMNWKDFCCCWFLNCIKAAAKLRIQATVLHLISMNLVTNVVYIFFFFFKLIIYTMASKIILDYSLFIGHMNQNSQKRIIPEFLKNIEMNSMFSRSSMLTERQNTQMCPHCATPWKSNIMCTPDYIKTWQWIKNRKMPA